MCLVKDSRSVTDDMTATHAAVRHLTCRVEGLGHKIFMDNFFSSPRLFDDLERHKENSHSTLWPNRLRTKKTEIDISGEDQRRFDLISLEGQTRNLHANSRRKYL